MKKEKCHSCIQCKKKDFKVLKVNLCGRCYYQKRNRERVVEIASLFQALNKYNEEIFNIYKKKVLASYIHNHTPPIAKKLAMLLESEEIPEIQSWENIYELSNKYRIRNGGKRIENRGCPFLKIRKELGIKHNLPIRKYYSIGTLEKYISRFHQDDVPYVQKFAKNISIKHKHKVTTDRYVRELLNLYKYLEPSTLLKVSNEVIVRYLQELNKGSEWNCRDHFYTMRSFYTWAMSENLIEVNPFGDLVSSSIEKECLQCNKMRSFRHEGDICAGCLSRMKNDHKLSKLTETIEVKTNYNEYLLSLYFKYINRYVISKYHVSESNKFKEYLKVTSIPILKTWPDIKKRSIEFEIFNKDFFKGGCPFIKIGKMLQELNVLPVAQQDHLIGYENATERLSISFRKVAVEFFDILIKRKYALCTCITYANILDQFQKWLQENHNTENVLMASNLILKDYVDQIKSKEVANRTMLGLRKFYNWTLKKKYILVNPLEGFIISKLDQSMLICSDKQIKNIIKYIKNPESSPECAMVLALIIYWGLTGVELRCSTIEIKNGLIEIQLYREKLSYGNKYYKRKEVLSLPDNPAWIKGLQKRFISQWEIKYQKVEKNFPHQLLLFTKSLKSNRPIISKSLLVKVYEGTLEATGEKIPPSVLRRTSGHIYSKTGEASILCDLGWSKRYAPEFLWKQKRYFSDIEKSKN